MGKILPKRSCFKNLDRNLWKASNGEDRTMHLPPDENFYLTKSEQQRIVELTGIPSKLEALRKQTRGTEWRHGSLLKRTKTGYCFYSYLPHILQLYASDPAKYHDHVRDLPLADALRHRLATSLYQSNLYSPQSTTSGRYKLLDFLAFPDVVASRLGESQARVSDENESQKFNTLLDIWMTLCKSGDASVFRQSVVLYENHSLHWPDVDLVFHVGISLIELAIVYGDPLLAVDLIKRLQYRLSLLSGECDREYYSVELQYLTLRCQHPRTVDTGLGDLIREYRRLYDLTASRSPRMSQMGERVRRRQGLLLRKLCRSACKQVAEHLLWRISESKPTRVRELLDLNYLVKEYLRPTAQIQYIKHSDYQASQVDEDLDTHGRLWAIVYAECYGLSCKDIEKQRSLVQSSKIEDRARSLGERLRKKRTVTINGWMQSDWLADWTHGIDFEDLDKRAPSLMWELQTSAIISVQMGRLSDEDTPKKYFSEALRTLDQLDDWKASKRIVSDQGLSAMLRGICHTELRSRGLSLP